MTAPALFAQIQGQGSVSADNLNTYEQTCDNVSQLRGFIGAPGIQVAVRGISTPGDGGQGAFQWNPTATGIDDGLTIIVPTGAPSTGGVWQRLQPYTVGIGVLPSATTVDLGSTYAGIVKISGTNPISGFGSTLQTGNTRIIVATGAFQLINSATMILLTSGNISVAAGDSFVMEVDTPGTWRMISYTRFSGGALSGATSLYTENTISTGQSLTNANTLQSYVATATLTITIAATSTLTKSWSNFVQAEGGIVTITPAAADAVNGGPVGTGIIIPLGASAFLTTDAAGNLYVQITTPPQSSAGYLNKFRNGTMDIWQRGTALTSVTAGSPAYSADGWIISCTGANVTWAQSSGRLLTSSSLQITGNTSVTDTLVKQRIEGVICAPLAGQVVVVQAQINNSTGASVTPTLTVKHANAVDNWSASTTDVSAANLQACANGAWTQVAYAFLASASSANGLEITFDFGASQSSNAKTIAITELDIRVYPSAPAGICVSPPQPELRPIASEQAFCERYFLAFIASSSNSPISNIVASAYSLAVIPCPVPVSIDLTIDSTIQFRNKMRTAPTGVIVSNSGHFNYAPTFSHASFDAVNVTLGTQVPACGGTTVKNNAAFTMTNASGFLQVTGAEL